MPFWNPTLHPFARTGTTPALYLPRSTESRPVLPGEYFLIKIHSAQVAFRGTVFDRVNQLVVTSKVNLHHPALGSKEVFAIQRTLAIRKNQAELLGLSPNLIHLVPATMANVSIAIEFILDTQNNLAKLGGLINNDAFLAAISLAPGAAAVAKTVGSLAQSIIQAFIPAQEHQPILQFVGDFNIGETDDPQTNGRLWDGYYVILGTRSDDDPLPNPLPRLEVRGDTLLADDMPITQLSYVVLEASRIPLRTRALNQDALWERKLREAELQAREIADDPFADDTARRQAWEKCKALLQEARALLLVDANYAARESDAIYKTVYKSCADTIVATTTSIRGTKVPRAAIDTPLDRSLFGIQPDEDLAGIVAAYAGAAADAETILRANKLL